MSILVINAGSSSIKFALHEAHAEIAEVRSLLVGSLDGLEPDGQPRLCWEMSGQKHERILAIADLDVFDVAFAALADLLTSLAYKPDAVAHRVVHGGWLFKHSMVVTEELLLQLTQFNQLAPLHQPHNIQGIRVCQKIYPALLQVACFDTAFHATVPELHCAFALPKAITDLNVRRYGFHGLSYQYIMGMLQKHSERANGRVVMAHLGNGASLCAAFDGKSCDTTMGFSALDGLMMGTRSGNLDPGVLLYLLEQGWTHDRIQTLLYKQSGLLGASGISADMRTLRKHGTQEAQQAIDLFTYRIVTQTGAMCCALGGLDILAFSGGIGEHDAVLRMQVCQQLQWLGVRVDEELNQKAIGDCVMPIHAVDSTIEVWVIPTDEGRVMACEATLICDANRSA